MTTTSCLNLKSICMNRINPTFIQIKHYVVFLMHVAYALCHFISCLIIWRLYFYTLLSI